MEDAIKDHFIANLPKKPYSSDDFQYGVKIGKAEAAIKRKYLQHNPPVQTVWLVFDCDRASPYESACQQSFTPPPNIEVVNKQNGHSHLFYGLQAPVTITEMARIKPIQYLAAIEFSLSQKLDADQNYCGLISKNPLHQDWHTIQRRSELWTLGELADWLDLPSKLPEKAQINGLGRNCTIFDTVRKWAYKEVLKYRLASNSQEFYKAVRKACDGVNITFPTPLSEPEIKAISKSIAKWVWSKYTGRLSDQDWAQYVKDTHTPEIQAARGRLSGMARNKKIELLKQEARELADGGFFTQAEIADSLGVSQQTISLWLK